jgi:DNA-binding MarR family transcriptional regulator
VGQPGGNVALDLFVVNRRLDEFLDAALAGSGISPEQYAVYGQLGLGPKTPRELCRSLGLRPPTLSGYLTAMDRRGHIVRSPSERDGRSHVISLTAAGRTQLEACRPRMRRAVKLLKDALGGVEEVAGVRHTLARVDAALASAIERTKRRPTRAK